MSKRKHCSISISEKVKLFKKFDQERPVKNVCNEYGVDRVRLEKAASRNFELCIHQNAPMLIPVLIEWIRQRIQNVPLD